MTEKEMAGWHHQFNGADLGKLSEVRQEASVSGMACCSQESQSHTQLGS